MKSNKGGVDLVPTPLNSYQTANFEKLLLAKPLSRTLDIFYGHVRTDGDTLNLSSYCDKKSMLA